VDLSRYHFNKLGDPPCPDGDDLGLGGAQPLLVPESDGLALPSQLLVVAARVPADAVVYPQNSGGTPVSRICMTKGAYHVMVLPMGSGMQFCLPADMLDPSDDTLPGSHVTADPEQHDVSDDVRTFLLRHFWQGQGYEVQPFGIRRNAPTRVRGQFELVKIGNRWFDGDDVHSQLGRSWILEQDGRLRFLQPWALQVEFTRIVFSNGKAQSL
jgi:hypothetical protein